MNELFHGIWIGPRVKVGGGLLLSHPRGIIFSPDTVIGSHCSILHQVTFGGSSIVVGNNVEILAGVKIINDKLKKQDLFIGDEAVLGAGSVILGNVPECAVVVGIPGKVVKFREKGDNWVNYRKNQPEQ
jgi:serine O-acetyltransferase